MAGTVTDPAGLAVPGTELVIRNVGTGAERRVTTADTGAYSVPLLLPGDYEVTATKQGFAQVRRQNLRLAVGQTLRVDIGLTVHAAEEVVNVTGEVPLVESEKSDVSQVIGQRVVQDVPLNGRRWDNLVLLTPGASEDGGFGGVSFRGINSLYNNNQVDGADNNQAFFSEARGRTRIAYGYSLSAIKEFNVSTAVYSAENGRAAGGVVNAVTKSGTNDWHGEAFYFLRDDAFIARDPVANASGQPKPEERRQQFGGAIGGPIVRDKLFFFANYDQQKRNFPAVIIPFGSSFFTPTGNTQAGNCTHADCPQVLAALDEITNTIDPRKGDQYIGLAKVDWQLNNNNRVSGVFNILRWDSPNGVFTGPVLTTTSLSNGTDIVDNEFITVTWNSVLSNTLVNEFRFQYGRDFEAQTPNAAGPQVQISDAANFGMPNFLPRGAFPNEKRFQWQNNTSWSHGSHQIRFGADINHVRDDIQNLFQGGGIYSYQNTGSTRNALLKVVQDMANGTRQYASFVQNVDPITGSGTGFFTTNDINFYIQDNWKARPNLTFNMGLRYEVQMMPDVVQGNPFVPESNELNTDTNNFGPRFGFAWGLGPEVVMRGGYGIYYGRTQNSSIFVHLFQNGVFQQSFRFTPSSCGAPIVPNTVFPQPSTAPPSGPLFGTSGPTGSATFNSLADFQAACPSAGALGSVIDVLASDFANPFVQQYDLAIESELPWGLSFSSSYLGSRGTRLPVWIDDNLPAPPTTRTYVVLDSTSTAGGSEVARVTLPFWPSSAVRPNTNVGVILKGVSAINSWYNGLVVRLRRRETAGFAFDANFTWSQARDNGQVAGVNGTFAGTTNPLDPRNLGLESGLSDIDIRRRFVMFITWSMPWANYAQSDAVKSLVGGWKLGTVIRVQDGRPLEAQLTNRPSGLLNGGLTGAAVNGNGLAVNGRAPHFARNTLFRTGTLAVVDLRIAREFNVSESGRLEILAEAFNLFNRTQRLVLNGQAFAFSAAGSGVCTAANLGADPATFGGCLTRNSSHLELRGTGNTLYGARQFQLGARFRF